MSPEANNGIRSIQRGTLWLVMLLVAFTVGFAWHSWESEKREHLESWTKLAELGARALDSYFFQLEKMLQLLSDDLFDRRTQLLQGDRARALLARFRQVYPEVLNIAVIEPDGEIVASLEGSLPPARNVSNASFQVGRRELEAGAHLAVGAPVQSVFNGTWLIPLRYGVRDGAGHLVYIVTVTLPVTNPHSFWSELDLPAEGGLGLLRDDGYVIARYPAPEHMTLARLHGEPQRASALYQHISARDAAAAGVVEGQGAAVAGKRLFVYQRLAHYPITFYVALPGTLLWWAWWDHMQFGLLLLLVLFVGVYTIYRSTLRRHRAWEAERAEAQQRVEDARSRLASLVGSARDAIVSIDEHETVTLFNAAAEAMFGYKASDILGTSLGRLIPQRFRAAHTEHVESLARTRAFPEGLGSMRHVTGVRSDGTELPLEASLSHTSMPDGRNYTVILRDVSDRRRAEVEIRALNRELENRVAQLEVSNAALASFSYSVSHDLRAPLRAIMGFSEMLLTRHSGGLEQDGRHYLDRIAAAAQRMGELIDALLSLSRLTRVSAVESERIDVSALSRAILADLREKDPARDVAIEVEEGIAVYGSRALLADVMENLLGNAWKFTSRRPEARISVTTMDDGAGCRAVCVRDNGVGFDMKYAGKLFGVFQRLHGTHEFEGTGVGLATVQRIVQLHGGRIWADARKGEGATFCFVMPQPDSLDLAVRPVPADDTSPAP